MRIISGILALISLVYAAMISLPSLLANLFKYNNALLNDWYDTAVTQLAEWLNGFDLSAKNLMVVILIGIPVALLILNSLFADKKSRSSLIIGIISLLLFANACYAVYSLFLVG